VKKIKINKAPVFAIFIIDINKVFNNYRIPSLVLIILSNLATLIILRAVTLNCNSTSQESSRVSKEEKTKSSMVKKIQKKKLD